MNQGMELSTTADAGKEAFVFGPVDDESEEELALWDSASDFDDEEWTW
ncbi:hypothetical protein [Pandoraea pnomenusa]